MRNKRYLVEVQETTGTLGIGRPRIAGTRIGLNILAETGLTKFKKYYPQVVGQIKELKV